MYGYFDRKAKKFIIVLRDVIFPSPVFPIRLHLKMTSATHVIIECNVVIFYES